MGVARGTVTGVKGMRPILRPLHTIVVLLLAAAALLLASEPGAVAGSRALASGIGHARPVMTPLAMAEIGTAQTDAVPCSHARAGRGSDHRPHLPCCSVPAPHTLSSEQEAVLVRDAQRVDPVRSAADPEVPAAHLRGIERPPKQG
jgi:hypothetical protein